MFDDKLNYCLNKISFDDLIVTKSDSYYQSEVPYITKNREKIILTIKYNMLKELTLKNNKIKEINVELNKNIILDKLDVGLSNKIAQDEENNYYLFNTRNSYSNSYSNFYISKLDDNFKIISSKASPSDMKFLSEKDLSSINNKIQIQSNLFVDKDLNSFRLKFENIPIEQQTSPLKPTILKINDALLYVYRNYFTIIKSGETNNLKEKI